MAKIKNSPEWMLARVHEYLSGQGSYDSIAKSNNIDTRTLKKWVSKYNEHGESAFVVYSGNAHYNKEFKQKCVESVLQGKGSIDAITAKYNISDRSVLRSWIKKYTANIELKDYDPKREVYMAESRRKTTIDERKEIVEYCIAHDNNYKDAAAKYDVSYNQVYSWVRKYQKDGDTGLIDHRGCHKSDNEVDELERLRRENLRLRHRLEEKDMVVELLKKVKEFERM